MNFKKIVIGIAALVSIAAVALGVKSQFSYKDTPQDRGNSLVENSSVNTSNIDASNIVKEELYAEGQGKKIYGYITAPKNYKEQKLPTIIASHGFGGNAER